MCGIIGYVGHKNTKGILLDGLKRLEYRGYDSSGIAFQFSDGKVELFRSEGKIENLEKKLTDEMFPGITGIGHTRWATHGAPIEKNAHPHSVGTITLVQNGIIENYLELKAELIKRGRVFRSDTDTEIIAHLYDEAISQKMDLKKATLSILPQLKGSYAMVVMSSEQPDILLGVRKGAPLLIGVGDEECFFASDAQAILHQTKKVIYLSDHQFAIISRKEANVFDEQGNVLHLPIHTINWTSDQLDKQGYRHYMLKEIHEQPLSISNTILENFNLKTNQVEIPSLAQESHFLKSIEKVYLVACGTARHASLIGKFYFEYFSKVPTEVDFASEFRYRNPILEKNSVVVLVSQSGETADTLAALREAKEKGVRTVAICNVRGSTLAREADFVLYTNAGPEIGVASTKAFTTQVVLLQILAIQMAESKQILSQAQISEFIQDLRKLPHLIETILTQEKQIEALARAHHTDAFFFYMARGINFPVALEGALKLKEISYIFAEGYPSGELKHGPIALVDPKTVILNLAPREQPYQSWVMEPNVSLYEKQMSNLQEVKARGGQIISIGSEKDSVLEKESDSFLGLPVSTWANTPILLTIPLQLLAYYVASLRGTDVDKPRNLAKSVTVE